MWVKREDLLPLAFGGNKLRNLEFLLGAALAEGADTLVTSGRPWSNHCRLTAAAGARAGLDVHLVLNGPPLDPPGPNHRLCVILGAAVHVAASGTRPDRDALVAGVAADLRAAGRRPRVIAVGGSGVTGAVGQVLAGMELAEQSSVAAVRPDVVILPTATGGTQAGLLVGLALAGMPARVRGMAVAHPSAELGPIVGGLVGDLVKLTGVGQSAVGPIEIEDGWIGAGYGMPSPAAHAAAGLLARTEGILVDPIYTAKALAGLVDGVRAGRFDGLTIVFWHAGGLPGLFEPLGPSG